MICFGFKLELVKHVPSYAQVLVGAKNTMFCRFWRRDRLPPAMLVILGYYWNLIVQHLSVFISSSSMHLCVEKWSHLQIDFFVACQHLCHAGMGSTRSEALWSSWQFGRWQCTVVPLIVLKDEKQIWKKQLSITRNNRNESSCKGLGGLGMDGDPRIEIVRQWFYWRHWLVSLHCCSCQSWSLPGF